MRLCAGERRKAPVGSRVANWATLTAARSPSRNGDQFDVSRVANRGLEAVSVKARQSNVSRATLCNSVVALGLALREYRLPLG
jgi:hypothetical protein